MGWEGRSATAKERPGSTHGRHPQCPVLGAPSDSADEVSPGYHVPQGDASMEKERGNDDKKNERKTCSGSKLSCNRVSICYDIHFSISDCL